MLSDEALAALAARGPQVLGDLPQAIVSGEVWLTPDYDMPQLTPVRALTPVPIRLNWKKRPASDFAQEVLPMFCRLLKLQYIFFCPHLSV